MLQVQGQMDTQECKHSNQWKKGWKEKYALDKIPFEKCENTSLDSTSGAGYSSMLLE